MQVGATGLFISSVSTCARKVMPSTPVFAANLPGTAKAAALDQRDDPP